MSRSSLKNVLRNKVHCVVTLTLRAGHARTTKHNDYHKIRGNAPQTYSTQQLDTPDVPDSLCVNKHVVSILCTNTTKMHPSPDLSLASGQRTTQATLHFALNTQHSTPHGYNSGNNPTHKQRNTPTAASDFTQHLTYGETCNNGFEPNKMSIHTDTTTTRDGNASLLRTVT